MGNFGGALNLLANNQSNIAGMSLTSQDTNQQQYANQLQAQHSIIDYGYYEKMKQIFYGGYGQLGIQNIPKQEKRYPQWHDRFKDVADYDPNTDSITIRATGERVYQSAIEDGYKPYLTNLDWLEHQIQTVRNYAYKDTSLRNFRPNRV